MKKILLALLVIALMPIAANATFLGIKKNTETISFFIRPPLDSLYGIQRAPDSVHIFTYADDATTATFSARSTTYPFSDISIDTVKHFTDTMYVFADVIGDIDGDAGNVCLAINVQMYYDKTPTHTFATVQIISDSLTDMADAVNVASMDADAIAVGVIQTDAVNADAIAANAIGASELATDAIGSAQLAVTAITELLDSLFETRVDADTATDSYYGSLLNDLTAIRDSIQYLITATGFSTFDNTSDSVIVDVSSAATAGGLTEVQATETSDSTWDKVLTGATFNIATSAGRRLRALVEPVSSGNAQVSGTPTDPGRYIILAAAESGADDFYNGTLVYLESGTGAGQTRTIGDYTGATDSATLHIGDDWIDSEEPDATTVYEIIPWAAQEITHIHEEPLANIADSVWSKDSSEYTIADGTMGGAVRDTNTYHGVVSVADMASIADSVWEEDTTGHYDVGYYGLEATTGSITSSDMASIADSVWEEDTTGHLDAGYYGLEATTGGAATITDADMGAISDSVWLKDTTGLLDAGTYGLEATTGGAANITDADMGAVADSVWDKAKADMYAVPEGAGDFLRDSLTAIHVEVAGINGWAPITDNDSLIIDQSSLEDMTIATVTDVTNQVTADVTAVSGDAAAADSLEAWLDGYADAQLTNREHLFTNLDEVLSVRSKIGDTAIGGDEIFAEVENLNGWGPITDNDSLIIDRSTLWTLFGDSAIARVDSSQEWVLKRMAIRAVAPDTPLVVQLTGAGDSSAAAVFMAEDSGWGVIFEGGETGTIADMQSGGMWIKSSTDPTAGGFGIAYLVEGGLDGTVSRVYTNGGDAVVYAAGGTTGSAMKWQNVNSSDPTLAIDTGSGGPNDSLNARSAASITDADMGAISDSVWLKDTTGLLDAGFYGLEATTGGASTISDAAMAAIADSVWQADLAGHDGVAGSFGDSAQGWGAIGSASGTGSDTILVFAMDTSGTDVAVQQTKITVKNAAGASILAPSTNDTGSVRLSLDPGSYTLVPVLNGYTFDTKALTVSGNSIDSVFGYNNPSPLYTGNLDRATVSGFIPDPNVDGGFLHGAIVRARRSDCKTATADSANTGVIVPNLEIVRPTDTLGAFSLPIPKSTEFDKTACGYWDIEATWGEMVLFKLTNVWVVGNFNVADSLAGRQ